MTALIGYAVNLPGAWYVVFLIGLFVATVTLVSLPARILWAYAQQHGPLAKRIQAGQALRAAYSAMETDFLRIRIEVNRALGTGTWWLPAMTLPTAVWQEYSSLLSRGESAEEREVFRVCQAAFVLGDEANRLVHRHHATPPTAEHLKTLEDLRDRVAEGLAILSKRLDSQAVNS